jgi:hypothetical protein
MILNPPPIFVGAKLKIKRANHHIDDLRTQFGVFIDREPYRLVVGHTAETRKATVQIKYRDAIPSWFALIIGDAVHNLRAALDHMTWELIGRDGGEQNRWLKLPTGQSRVDFESACKGIKTPSQSVIDILKALEVFPGGKGDALYSLHLLDNSDKHTVLTPILGVAKASLRAYWPNGNSQAWSVTVLGTKSELVDIGEIPPGGHVEFGNDAKATPDIFFDNVQGFKNKPIIPTLRHLSDATRNAIDTVAESSFPI